MRKEFCGIFAVTESENAAEEVYLGLYALQHRGQESAGIVSNKGRKFFVEKGMGLVNTVFDNTKMKRLKGTAAIGHVRYSTAGSSSFDNIQPLVIKYANTPIAIAHNGNIPNSKKIRRELEKEGVIFSTDTDSEVILKLIAKEKGSWEDRLRKSLNKIKGAFSLILFLPGKVIAVRDSYGFRPLSMGVRKDSIFFSSESCAFDIIGAKYLRELEPGEMVIVEKNTVKTMNLSAEPHKACIFELIYFSRPDSYVFSQSVYDSRFNMGKELAKEKKIKADIVMPVPDSANIQALGYSRQSGIEMNFGFIRNHYIGRTFIEPHQKIRDFRVKIKYSPVIKVLKGKRVIVIDDSIVRGTTSKKLINIIKKAGAKEVHLLISSPPIIYPCYYGIDTPSKKELIASVHSVAEIKKFLKVDTLHYLSMDGLLSSCKKRSYCSACFDGTYPLK